MLNPRLSALRRSGGEDQSRRVRIEASALMQTKTHVSMSLQSHFAAHGHCTARQSRSVFAAAKGVPMTRPVTPVHPTGQAPCQPIANRHAAMEPLCTLACKDQMRTQAPCKNGVRPLRPYLRVQVFNAGRRLNFVLSARLCRSALSSYNNTPSTSETGGEEHTTASMRIRFFTQTPLQRSFPSPCRAVVSRIDLGRCTVGL